MSQKLITQLSVIRELMIDGQWRTLGVISAVTGYPPASISAQLRHLRKPTHGSFIVEKRSLEIKDFGMYQYRLTPRIIG